VLCTAQNSTLGSDTFRQKLEQIQIEEANFRKAGAYYRTSPHALYQPTLTHDGVSWVAVLELKGENLVGRGASPYAALSDFDSQWMGVK